MSPAQSLLDDYGLKEVTGAAEAVKQAVEQGLYQKATELWSVTETVVEQVSHTNTTVRHFALSRQRQV